MHRIILIIWIWLPLMAANILSAAPTGLEQLIIIFDKEQDLVFQEKALAGISQLAEEEDLQLILKETKDGVPRGITSTPAIIYQNSRGRAIYASRYTELATIKNFVRISRISRQSDALLEKTNVLLQKQGRAQIALALKITDWQGNMAIEKQAEKNAQIKKALAKSMDNYSWKDKVALQRSDRIFYLDIHPYQDKQGKVYLSTAIFSQFSCIDPIYLSEGAKVEGSEEEIERLIAQIGQQTADFIKQTLASSSIGDALSMIPERVKDVSWEELDLRLPAEEKATKNIAFPEGPIPSNWVMSGAVNDKTPIIQFHFMAPLERYAGEVRKAEGEMKIAPDGRLQEGQFVVDVKSLTMGMESFDAKVLKSYLKAQKYSESSFKFQDVQLNEALRWGQNSSGAIRGEFNMKGKTKIVTMNANIIPTVDDKGAPILIVSADFSLNITDLFGIKGPDGPDPAKKTLQFNLNFLMNSIQKS